MKKFSFLALLILLICFMTACVGENITITYPEGFFTTGEELQQTADSMKGSEGMKKVEVNPDGSLTLEMTQERYEKIKNAAESTVTSIPIYAISDNTAIRDFAAEEDFKTINITVYPEHEKIKDECSFVIYAVRLFHVCNMDNDAVTTVNYINIETNEIYMTERYNVNGELVEENSETATNVA